jgi:4a-hydroxytetrahydrobiopterin dehydratase
LPGLFGLGTGGNPLHTRRRRAFKSRTSAIVWLVLRWPADGNAIGPKRRKTFMAELLRPEAVQVLLEEVPKWKLSDNSIERTLTFGGFSAAIEFVVQVAKEAEEMNHHPDIDIRWNKVKLVLSTHSAGGLTDADFLLARKIDKLHGE